MGKNKQLRKTENRKVQAEASLQAMADYAKKLEFLQEQSSKLSVKVSGAQRRVRTASLALNHLESTRSDSDRYFVQLGRAFMQQPYESVISDLHEDITSAESELPKLTATLQQFENLRKEQIDQMSELKQQ